MSKFNSELVIPFETITGNLVKSCFEDFANCEIVVDKKTNTKVEKGHYYFLIDRYKKKNIQWRVKIGEEIKSKIMSGEYNIIDEYTWRENFIFRAKMKKHGVLYGKISSSLIMKDEDDIEYRMTFGRFNRMLRKLNLKEDDEFDGEWYFAKTKNSYSLEYLEKNKKK